MPTRVTAAAIRRRLVLFFVLVALHGALAGCGPSSDTIIAGDSMPPDARKIVLTGSTPLKTGSLKTGSALFLGVVNIDGAADAVLLEVGVGPRGRERERYPLRQGEHLSVDGWEIQVADVNDGSRKVTLFVAESPEAPPTNEVPAS